MMIKEIRFKNWKSFHEAVLQIDPLTVLIGTNASGKSNALDGLRFLNHIAMGIDLRSALAGDASGDVIRGGVEWAAMKPHTEFTIEALIQQSEIIDYQYSITVQTFPKVSLLAESITRFRYRSRKNMNNPYTIRIFRTDDSHHGDSPSIIARLYNEKSGTIKECSRATSVLAQLSGQRLRAEIMDGLDAVRNCLSAIFVLDPIPSLMRMYSSLSSNLETDASNIAGVLAALPDDRRRSIEEKISEYTSRLPEKDLKRVWSEPVGRFKADAMLYCEEQWTYGGDSVTIDARSMSDGTLRFISIMVALLTRPIGSQIVIEEVDNGLHPARVNLLLEILQELGANRGIDVLITTHNPALLDAMGPEMVPFVEVADRDTPDGSSELTLLEDINSLPKILASGSLGKATTQGKIEEGIRLQRSFKV